MKLFSDDVIEGEAIDSRFAFGKPAADEPMTLAENLNPGFRWADLPTDTKSLALICIDPDVPADASDVNQEDKSIPADAERTEFCHWLMIDIAPALEKIEAGSCSRGVTKGGKQKPAGPPGSRQGLNNYTQFMAGSEMAGDYFGYDGPCPPWNDLRLHHYQFCLYALDIERLELAERFDLAQVQAAMDGHVLDQACITGTYTLNPEVAD